MGIYGASTSTARVEGDSDNGAFAVAGLPGIGAQQDPIEYNSTSWRTNLDNYERIVPDDVMKNAVITASIVLHIANREAMMPRFPASEMPAVPAGGGERGNARPTAESRVFVVDKNKALTVAAPGLLPEANAQAAAAASTTTKPSAELDAAPTHGKVVLKADGSFVYTPSKDYTGSDSSTYKITGGTETIPGTATLVVK